MNARRAIGGGLGFMLALSAAGVALAANGATETVTETVTEGAVTETWTGFQAIWPMARGYEGQFGHVLNAPYVWLPLCAIFLAGLWDWRKPWKLAHLDLLVLLSFGISHIFYNAGEIEPGVWLSYPPLIYLLVRMTMIGLGRSARGGIAPSARTTWLAFGTIVLIAFRITLNVVDSGVIDVGYAGVIGADRLTSERQLWGEGQYPEDNATGDTYGPANYIAYVPFHQALGWSGRWDELPAARAAAIAFDLLAIAGLLALGLVLSRRGPPPANRLERHRTGIILAFAWTAFPYTDFALQSSSNDALLAAGVIWSLVLFNRPLVRGALLAATAMTKFAPLILVPLFVAGRRRLRLRGEPGERSRRVIAGFVVVSALLLLIPLLDSGLGTFWERTIAKQADRDSIFSLWGFYELEAPSRVAWVLAAGFALSLAFWPRRRRLAQVCALSAAALIASQLVIEHWFYLYIPWFLGPLLAALVSTPSRRVPQA